LDRINRNQIYRSSQLVTAMTGVSVQPHKAIVGANAFSHASGVHQDGMLKNKSTYEIMRPDVVGLGKSSLILGKHSGMSAFSSQVQEMGYTDIPTTQMRDIFSRFKLLADKKKTVTESDLRCLLNDEINQPREYWTVHNLQISAGNKMTCTATLCLTHIDCSDVQRIDAATGNGPVDAIFQTINRIADVKTTLEEYEVKAVSSGSDAMGHVTIRLGDCSVENSTKYHGQGADVDILYASAKAYVNAVNRMIAARIAGAVKMVQTAEKTASPI
jgi:2-isopropylmalate synthase